jgi:hypothetical protein
MSIRTGYRKRAKDGSARASIRRGVLRRPPSLSVDEDLAEMRESATRFTRLERRDAKRVAEDIKIVVHGRVSFFEETRQQLAPGFKRV